MTRQRAPARSGETAGGAHWQEWDWLRPRSYGPPYSGVLRAGAMLRNRLAAASLVALLACGGAIAPFTESHDAFTSRGKVLRLPDSVLAVPVITQNTDYSCGDVATLALLRFWKHDEYARTDESALYGPLGTTAADGTDPRSMAAFLGGVPGLAAEFSRGTATVGELFASIDRGEPVIVDLEAWQAVRRAADLKPWESDWDDGHYVVLMGYDADVFYCMDPSTPSHYAYIPRPEFESRWHDVLGTEQVQHMAVFVHSITVPYRPERLPRKVTRIN